VRRFALLLLFAVRALAGIGPPDPDIVGTAGHRVLFNAGLDLWSSDGTAEETMRVFSAIVPGSIRVQFHGLLYFTKPVGKSYGNPQLWRTDGTAAGTQLVVDAIVGIQAVTVIGDSLWIQTPQRTYLSDGTAAGTVVVPQLPWLDSWPDACAGRAFFTSGGTLWQTDASLHAQPVATLDGVDIWHTCAAGRIFLVRNIPGAGYNLWASDGSPDGTTRLREFSAFQPLAALDNRLFFKPEDGKLWSSDGTAAGTLLVKDIRPVTDTDAGNLPFAVALNGRILFTADDDVFGRELWASDGTAAGTFMVRDIAPLGASSNIASLAAVRGLAFFSAEDSQHGAEPWQSDGTAEGTRPVADVAPGGLSSHPAQFVAAGDKLFFTATGTPAGRELYAMPIDWRTISIDDAHVAETAGTATLTVSLDGPAKERVTAMWCTTRSGECGSLVFQPGETRKTISLAVDRHPEAGGNHFIDVRLSGVSGAVLAKSFGTVIVEDVDATADLVLSLARSKDRRLDSYDVVVKNLGPSTVPSVTLRLATLQISERMLPSLHPGDIASTTLSLSLDELLGVTATSLVADPNPANNSASLRLSPDQQPWASTLRLALMPGGLTAGMHARLLIDSITPREVRLTSSNPAVIALPPTLTTSAEITEVEIVALAAGSTTIVADAPGAASVSMAVDVQPTGPAYRWPPKMTFKIDDASLVFGTPRRLAATLSGIAYDTQVRPTGNVAFADNGNIVATVPLDLAFTASTVVDSLLPGDHTITASYSGDAKFLPESKSMPLHIFGALEPTFSASISPLDDGRALVTIAATPVARVPPTGTISVTREPFRTAVAENLPLVAGIAALILAPPFPPRLTVEYSGDAIYRPTARVVPLLPPTRRRAAH
jgi:ELWxxDGT repeat protein